MKTHCPHGHEYVGRNIKVRSDGRRECRTCDLTRKHDRHAIWRKANPVIEKPKRTYCKNGHELTEGNLVIRRGWRKCRTCERECTRRNWRKRYPLSRPRSTTHCIRGHELTGENVKWRGNRRNCKICNRMHAKAQHIREKQTWTEEQKQAQRAYMKEYRKGHYAKNKKEIRAYHRNRHLKLSYGLTETEYQKLFDEQKGLCKICGKQGKLFIDHCHRKRVVRALLCNTCNWGLGQFHDDPDLMRAAIAYLESY